MEGSDIIAFLYPLNDRNNTVSKQFKVNPQYVAPRLEPPQPQYSRHERESTEPPENPGASDLDYLPCLCITFGHIPRTNRGLIFGSKSDCDVKLSLPSVSNHHFSLTFDNYNRLIVKDLNSLVCTEVTYNDEGKGPRRDFQWIVGGHDVPRTKRIIIKLPDIVSFQLVVPFHTMSAAYIEKVKTFKQGAATTRGLVNNLSLSNLPTRYPTGAHTPDTGEICLTRKLGEGSFGTVTHLWNVSTGDERVEKTPSAKAIRKKKVDHNAWREEARIMGQVSHPHVVRLIDSVFTPLPQLYMEYMPCGALDQHEDISYHETLAILCQCLSALKYLHGRDAPIAHRDIKPANILVQHRVNGDIHVKLGDFGLSRDSSELKTLCGTREFLAPEVYTKSYIEPTGYTPTVDIWSLGVVACWLTCGLPQYLPQYENDGVVWCKNIVTRLQNNFWKSPNDLGQFLLKTMVILSPKTRYSASDCYDLVVGLSVAEEDSVPTLTGASCAKEVNQRTHRYNLRSHSTQDQTTVVYQPRSRTRVATLSNSGSSATPPPASSSNKAPVTPSSSAARQYTICQKGKELQHFYKDDSENPFHPLYVGSSLAAQLGGDEEEWDSQFSRSSVQQGSHTSRRLAD